MRLIHILCFIQFFLFWQVQSSIHHFLFHKYIFDFSVTLHTCFNTFWVPVAPLFCHCRCQLGLVLFSGDALILKWKNDTNPQSCSSAPLPSPVVPASHSKQKHALFSLTHMHKNTQMSSSLFHLLFHMCLCLSLTHCPLFGIRVRASISTVVNTSTLPWPEQIIPAPLCFFSDEISSEAKARKTLRKHSYISLRGS